MPVLEGTQTGFTLYAFSNRTPVRARLSIAGVFTHRLPVQLIIVAFC
jgi:hypothetical protein